ncbi:hypothetical protein CR152_29910 [Massilia violaceinigra]|uniref:SH3b domain-containing protein n=1 Tax=Massilia violaceinigra TaxID=2045208 RepID=A0A2D2DTF1_9BURK|nr:hypothetical protein [Massilia violaceinigra]ATQ78255.1 hypothetical protein CR152_29910 [Massilia violaceinigra]
MTYTNIKELTTAILFVPLLAFAAAPDTKTSIETRHGRVDVSADTDATHLLVAGKKIATIGAGGASLFRIPAVTEREYIVVQGSRPGLHCQYSYRLLALSDSAPKVSKEFGECLDLGGAGMAGAEPVVHLNSRVDPEAGVETYQWEGDDVILVFESPTLCGAAGFLAQKNAAPVKAPLASRVKGPGRLQLLSAPDTNCAMHGVFVVPGDSVTASLASDGYVYVNYTNPKSGRKVQGWVPRERLSDL